MALFCHQSWQECDGVGGTVKREAARASLQATTTGHILSPKDLYEWAQAHIKHVTFFFISKEEVASHRKQQLERFKHSKTVAGTRSHHSYIPGEHRKLLVKRVSGDETAFEVAVTDFQDEVRRVTPAPGPTLAQAVTLIQCEPGQYVGCLYDNKWWVGLIREKSDEEGDLLIVFMHPHGPARSFHWPAREDICWVPLQDILSIIQAPTTPNGRNYFLDEKDQDY